MQGWGEKVVVIDNGSDSTKAGFAGYDAPQVIFQTVMCRLPSSSEQEKEQQGIGHQRPKCCFGREALVVGKDAKVKVRFPVENGLVTNWDDMEQIWHHTFYDILHVAPEEQPVMLTETVFPPPRSREKMVEYMIETFNVPKFFVGIQPVFALYASGRVNGIVIESGHGASHTISVCDGYMLPHATQRSTVAGASITEQLLDELVAKGYNLNREDHLDIVRDIKEKMCCTAIDNANLFTTTQPLIEKTFELPDGEVITIGNERLRCVEPLFVDDAPESCSLSRMARETLERCNVDIIREMYGNIVLAGGSTLIPGVHDRLQNELGRLHPTLRCNVVAPSDRKISAWIGGSILASCAEFRDKWITKDEYDEQYVSFLLD